MSGETLAVDLIADVGPIPGYISEQRAHREVVGKGAVYDKGCGQAVI